LLTYSLHYSLKCIPDEETDLLSHIILILNENFGSDLTDDDKVDLEKIKSRYEQHEELRAVMNESNTKDNMKYKSDKVIDSLLLEFVNTKIDIYKKLTDPKVNEMLKNKLFEGHYQQYTSGQR